MVSSAQVGFQIGHKKAFSELLWCDTVRGADSTGVFGVTKQGNVEFLKTVGPASDLVRSKEFEAFSDNIYSDYHVAIGHNRSATRGTVTDENAHPFVEKNIILVHNGTLTSFSDLTTETVEVDSHAILHSISEIGHEETLKKINGAFTLVWYNADEKTLYAIRNKERPLFIANCYGAWFLASEEEMLSWILERNSLKVQEMTECKPGVLYSFKLDNKENMFVEPMELYSPPKFISLVGKQDDKSVEVIDLTKSSYENLDFPIGTRVLIDGKRLAKVEGTRQDGFSKLFYGDWWFDSKIRTKTWITPEEEVLLDIDEDDANSAIITAEIMCVMSKGNNITLVCRNPRVYTPIIDSRGNEIYEDEFIFTQQHCSYCNTAMTFEDATKGLLKFTSAEDYEMMCPDCLDKDVPPVVN